MKKYFGTSRKIGLVWCLFVCITILSCDEEVVVPTSDSTPPTVKLSVIGIDDAPMITESTPDAELTAGPFQRFTVMATGTDRDGGVLNITLSFSQTVYYDLPGDHAGSSHGDGYVDNPAIARVGSTVPVTRAVAKAFEMRQIRESVTGEETFQRAELTFRAIAENFHDGVAHSAQLTIRHP